MSTMHEPNDLQSAKQEFFGAEVADGAAEFDGRKV
jgi:hypothetical protein